MSDNPTAIIKRERDSQKCCGAVALYMLEFEVLCPCAKTISSLKVLDVLRGRQTFRFRRSERSSLRENRGQTDTNDFAWVLEDQLNVFCLRHFPINSSKNLVMDELSCFAHFYAKNLLAVGCKFWK